MKNLNIFTSQLCKPLRSIPANPLLAEPMYLFGSIELLGTGTGDIIRLCKEKGLKEPEFIQEENFMENYIQPALDAEYIELTIPGKPTSINQKYRLTTLGKSITQQLMCSAPESL